LIKTDERGTIESINNVEYLIQPSAEWLEQNKTSQPIITEPIDEEKVMLAEAIIAQAEEIEALKARLTAANL